MALTTTFLASVVTAVQTSVNTNFTHGGVGTGTTPATSGDTDLESQVIRKARFAIDISGSDNVVITSFFDATEANGSTLTEHGWFNSASGGTLYNRQTGFSVSKTSDIELTIETDIGINVLSV